MAIMQSGLRRGSTCRSRSQLALQAFGKRLIDSAQSLGQSGMDDSSDLWQSEEFTDDTSLD